MPTLNLGRVGFVNKGTWSGATAYKINDTVTYLGGTYACLIANTGQTPVLGGTIYWQEWVSSDTMHLSGTETATGQKTFSLSPIVPTATPGDNTTKTASTAFVAAEIPYQIHAATSKTIPVDADEFALLDSAATYGLKKLTYANLKAAQKTYNDTLYASIGSNLSGVRQTVQYSLVDTNGFPNYITIGTGLSVNIAATAVNIAINAAGGKSALDRVGTISADTTISSLTASSTLYLYADIAVGGAVTLGFTTLAPIYSFGGTPSIVNGQFTFNIGEMTGYLGNGTTAPQAWRVYIGEAVTNATNVTSVVNYALNGKYEGVYATPLPAVGTLTSANHNLGVQIGVRGVCRIKCLTAEVGYSVGDEVENIGMYSATSGIGMVQTYAITNKVIKFTTGSTQAFTVVNLTSGNTNVLTSANWSYKLTAKREW